MLINEQDLQDLIERLQGNYTVPVNDGGGLLNGKDTFTRKFDIPPINLEAVQAIKYLQEIVKNQSRTAEGIIVNEGDT